MITIVRYELKHKLQWDEFIKLSKNGHFMFCRDFMEYHSDRFDDFSLLAFDDKMRLVGLLPANKSENQLCSHSGLSFGGLILPKKISISKAMQIFDSLFEFMKNNQISTLRYKRIPDIYSTGPSQEDLYALFLRKARLTSRELNSVIDLNSDYRYSKGRKWSVKKASKTNLVIDSEPSLTEYWELLTEVLLEQHGKYPTHSIDEILYLKQKNPNNIQLHTVRLNSELVAGALMFVNRNVVHTQYMANNTYGRETDALDFLLNHLITQVYKQKRYFSFGISTENFGNYLNVGLASQKEGYGAQSIVQDCYEVSLV